jgi:microcystin-dependent protein
MSVEVATYISQLQPVNPPGTDPTAQGDDHIRLIKSVLQSSFPSLSTPFYPPNNTIFSASGNIPKAVGNGVNFVNTTSGAVTLTLPTLVAGDGFWQTTIMKYSSDGNPVFIVPPGGQFVITAGLLLTKARRCIPGIAIQVFWDGTNYQVTRTTGLPIGSLIPCWQQSLPPGYEWPNGQTLTSVATNYPEYNAIFGSGTTPDMRGRVGVALDNLGGTPAGRLSVINGNTVGNTGGTDAVTLNATQIPAHQHNVYLKDNGHAHTGGGAAGATAVTAVGGTVGFAPSNTGASSSNITIGSVNGVANDNLTAVNAGGGGAHSNLQPSIMVSQILVVE